MISAGTMADQLKALPARAESRFASPPEISSPWSASPAPAPLQPLDFDGTLALSDATLRSMACDSPVPGTRLAAAWRLMMRGQALPTGAPGEGLRCLTLLNLATQQDLEILEVLVCLDPSTTVRAQAAVLLWRVARDRDRVVDRLVAQLGVEAGPDVLVQLLSLVPALPFEKTQSAARSYLGHPSLDVRRAGWNYWLQNGGSMDRSVTALIWGEPSRELRAWSLEQWASGPSAADIVGDLGKVPEATGAALEALSRAGRSFRLVEMSPLLDHRHLDTVLRLARRPFDVADRRILLSLTGLMTPARAAGPAGPDSPDRRPWRPLPRLGWMSEALRRCLREAYEGQEAPALTEEERTWALILGEKLATLEAEAPIAEEQEDDDDEYLPPADDLDDLRELLRLLTSAETKPS